MEIRGKVQQQLKRWYTISCLVTLLTFSTLAIIQSLTFFKLQQLPPMPMAALTTSFTSLPTSNTHEHEHEQAKEISILIKKQKKFLPILMTTIEAIPESVQITKLLIEPTARIEYTGKVTNQTEISELVDNLHKAGYQDIMKLDIQETFHLILNIVA